MGRGVFLRVFMAVVFLFTQVDLSFASYVPLKGVAKSVSQVLGYVPAGRLVGVKFPDGYSVKFVWELDKYREMSNEEKDKNIKFFLTALAVPNEDLWVNLDVRLNELQVIGLSLWNTDLGKVMLWSDVRLKEDVKNLADKLGIWEEIMDYAVSLSQEKNDWVFRPKFWIVPGEIDAFVDERGVAIRKAKLDVKCELYRVENGDEYQRKFEEFAIRKINKKLIPALRWQVNNSIKYSLLRQVYTACILSQWYKAHLKGTQQLFDEVVDSVNLTGLTSKENWNPRYFLDKYAKIYFREKWDDSAFGIFNIAVGGEDLTNTSEQVNPKTVSDSSSEIKREKGNSIESMRARITSFLGRIAARLFGFNKTLTIVFLTGGLLFAISNISLAATSTTNDFSLLSNPSEFANTLSALALSITGMSGIKGMKGRFFGNKNKTTQVTEKISGRAMAIGSMTLTLFTPMLLMLASGLGLQIGNLNEWQGDNNLFTVALPSILVPAAYGVWRFFSEDKMKRWQRISLKWFSAVFPFAMLASAIWLGPAQFDAIRTPAMVAIGTGLLVATCTVAKAIFSRTKEGAKRIGAGLFANTFLSNDSSFYDGLFLTSAIVTVGLGLLAVSSGWQDLDLMGVTLGSLSVPILYRILRNISNTPLKGRHKIGYWFSAVFPPMMMLAAMLTGPQGFYIPEIPLRVAAFALSTVATVGLLRAMTSKLINRIRNRNNTNMPAQFGLAAVKGRPSSKFGSKDTKVIRNNVANYIGTNYKSLLKAWNDYKNNFLNDNSLSEEEKDVLIAEFLVANNLNDANELFKNFVLWAKQFLNKVQDNKRIKAARDYLYRSNTQQLQDLREMQDNNDGYGGILFCSLVSV